MKKLIKILPWFGPKAHSFHPFQPSPFRCLLPPFYRPASFRHSHSGASLPPITLPRPLFSHSLQVELPLQEHVQPPKDSHMPVKYRSRSSKSNRAKSSRSSKISWELLIHLISSLCFPQKSEQTCKTRDKTTGTHR